MPNVQLRWFENKVAFQRTWANFPQTQSTSQQIKFLRYMNNFSNPMNNFYTVNFIIIIHIKYLNNLSINI